MEGLIAQFENAMNSNDQRIDELDHEIDREMAQSRDALDRAENWDWGEVGFTYSGAVIGVPGVLVVLTAPAFVAAGWALFIVGAVFEAAAFACDWQEGQLQKLSKQHNNKADYLRSLQRQCRNLNREYAEDIADLRRQIYALRNGG